MKDLVMSYLKDSSEDLSILINDLGSILDF